MANKRDTSKQKRARENRAQREARKARAEAASTPRPSRQPPASSRAAKAKGSTGAATATKNVRPPRPARPGDTPVDIETLEGNWYSKRMQVPGGRQVVMAVALAVLVIGMSLFIDQPEQAAPKASAKPPCTSPYELLSSGKFKGKCGLPKESFLDRYHGPGVIGLVAIFVIAVGSMVVSLSHRRRRYWMVGSIVSFIVGLALGQVPIFFIGGFLGYALWRANKVEGPDPRSRAARIADERAAAADAKAADEPADAPDDDES